MVLKVKQKSLVKRRARKHMVLKQKTSVKRRARKHMALKQKSPVKRRAHKHMVLKQKSSVKRRAHEHMVLKKKSSIKRRAHKHMVLKEKSLVRAICHQEHKVSHSSVIFWRLVCWLITYTDMYRDSDRHFGLNYCFLNRRSSFIQNKMKWITYFARPLSKQHWTQPVSEDNYPGI